MSPTSRSKYTVLMIEADDAGTAPRVHVCHESAASVDSAIDLARAGLNESEVYDAHVGAVLAGWSEALSVAGMSS